MSRRCWAALSCALGVVLTSVRAEACGPCLSEAAFTTRGYPDRPFLSFTRGRLGVLRPNLHTRVLAYAFRRMNGIATATSQEEHLASAWERVIDHPPGAVEPELSAWTKAREAAGLPISQEPVPYDELDYQQFNRINADAFRSAEESLQQLQSSWARWPGLLEEWANRVGLGGGAPRRPTHSHRPLPRRARQ